MTSMDGQSMDGQRRPPQHVEALREEAHRGHGRLLSGIICVNILILGISLVAASALNSVAITAEHLQIFLIILLLLSTLWMLFYMVFTSRKDQGRLFKDSHAGPVWLKAGLVLFGLLSLLMDIFKMATYVGYLHCDSGVKVAFPAVQAVHLFVQTYFLWIHAKDCVQQHTNLTRCGLIITLSTNLVVWMAAVTEESLHQTGIPHLNTSSSHGDSSSEHKCNCSHSACDTFKDAFFYLYPFNVEYSLFAAAMAYVMWKNVGRFLEDHNHHKMKFRPKDVCLGPVLGVLLVLAGILTFIFYEPYIQTDDEEQRKEALVIHFSLNMVIVTLMSISTVIGCVAYRLDHRDHVSEKNPSRSLDVGLLVGASMGQFIICYFTIVAVVATEAKSYLNALNLAWAVMLVLQLGLQNYFIIEGLNREPFHVTNEAALHTSTHVHVHEHAGIGTIMERNDATYFKNSGVDKPEWKRRVLKEVCAFLLLANIILWIMPAFGARPQFNHSVEMHFYKYTLWTAVVNIGLPFGIFYRMHSAASLFEVYLMS
ncbi:proton channel OTOP2 [Cololabis saira]|uniref:proton channel OTOP2 n=1 Tax=Cololabis saira TaxID=129043 RepID=UPI002AD2D839|nr:proton channel OTOP2 [Cololabis saira]